MVQTITPPKPHTVQNSNPDSPSSSFYLRLIAAHHHAYHCQCHRVSHTPGSHLCSQAGSQFGCDCYSALVRGPTAAGAVAAVGSGSDCGAAAAVGDSHHDNDDGDGAPHARWATQTAMPSSAVAVAVVAAGAEPAHHCARGSNPRSRQRSARHRTGKRRPAPRSARGARRRPDIQRTRSSASGDA